MASRQDRMLERILIRQKNNKICTLPRASTLHLVRLETVRRCKADGCDRIIYMAAGAELRIRMVGEGKTGDQTSLYHVNHKGRITELNSKGK
jgi:hypothetical protein